MTKAWESPGSPQELCSASGAAPPMDAPLAINGPRRPSPAVSMGFDEYYVYSSEESNATAHCPEGFPAQEALSGAPGGKETRGSSDISPRSYGSGMHTLYTPDSATSPNSPPSPQSISQKIKEEGGGGKKAKTRTAFSQKQLQILHHRFQNQKYLSPQQIREMAAALGLTYKQIKTWFQNQRMKFKRTQKESLWMRKVICPPQNGYLEMNPNYHQSYSIGEAVSIHVMAGVHENLANNQPYANNQNYSSDHQIYGNPQNFYPIMSGEEGSCFGKAAGTSYSQQAVGYISQQKMNFYHGFPASFEYATVKTEDGYPFPNASATETATFPGTSALQHYQAPLQTQGAQSSCAP